MVKLTTLIFCNASERRVIFHVCVKRRMGAEQSGLFERIVWGNGFYHRRIDAIWPCAFTFLICLSFLLTSSQQVFVCVPRCTEQSDKKKIIPYGFQTPYSLCTGLHRFGTLITSLIIVPLHNQFIPVEKIWMCKTAYLTTLQSRPRTAKFHCKLCRFSFCSKLWNFQNCIPKQLCGFLLV